MTHDTPELAPTRVDVSDLIDAPGATRQVELDVPVPDGFEVPLTTFGGTVEVDGVLESLVDGVLLRGTFTVEVDQQCSACLEPVPTDTVTADVAELFSDPADAEDPDDVEQGYAIRDGVIDIDPAMRDALAEAVPAQPRCREDCKGLCPSCGINRNEGTCDCGDDQVDDRWAALANINLN